VGEVGRLCGELVRCMSVIEGGLHTGEANANDEEGSDEVTHGD